MIQKYTCVPVSEYEVLVVSNGSVAQVDRALGEINAKTENAIPASAHVVYFETLSDVMVHLALDGAFAGKVVFMFFNGVEYVQQFLSEMIDHYHRSQKRSATFANAYFYLDASVASDGDAGLFAALVNIANDILKKSSFLLRRIRGVYLDDMPLLGERTYCLRGLVRNFPTVERIELSGSAPVQMNYLVV